jgi:drug/metabolite transporter (DMT)-like permease
MTNLSTGPLRVLLWVLLVLSNGLWGASWVVAKIALHEFSPLQIASWRMILAGVVLLPVVVLYLRSHTLPRSVWMRIFVLSIAQAVLAKWFGYWGLEHTTAANAGLLMALEPGFTIALAAVVLGERMTALRLGSLALGAMGAYLIVFRDTGWPSLSGATVVGDAVFIIGLLLEAVYSVGSKPLNEQYAPLVIAAAPLVVALPVWIPLAIVDAAVEGTPTPTWTGWLAIAYFAIGCTVFGYVVWNIALRHLQAGAVALTVFIQPVVGTLAAVAILDEQLTAPTLAGAVLVMASLGLIVITPAPHT